MRIIRLATVRHVRTQRGVEFFHAPIGTPITEEQYQELLRQRRLMRSAYEKGHPHRLEAERNVRRARKERRNRGVSDEEEDETPAPSAEKWARSLSDKQLDEILTYNRPSLSTFSDEQQNALFTEQARRYDIAQAEKAKLAKFEAEISDAEKYYENYDPNYDPAREDVAKPLWHALQGAIENAEETYSEGRRGAYGDLSDPNKESWVPREEWDRAFINLIYSAVDDNSYGVEDHVDIREAARRWRNQEFGKLDPRDREWDRVIHDSWHSAHSQAGNSSEARRIVAEQQGTTVGDISRALDRFWSRQRSEEANRKINDPAREVAESVPFDLTELLSDTTGVDRDEMMSRIRDSLTWQARKVPEIIKNVRVAISTKLGKETWLGSYAYSGGQLTIHPNVLTAANRHEVLQQTQVQRWWVPFDPHYELHDVVTGHEVGHGVSTLFGTQRVPQDEVFWREFARSLGMLDVPPIFDTRTDSGRHYIQADVDRWIKRNAVRIRNRISKYGASSSDEMLAELWSEYTMTTRPRPPAKLYGDYVMKKLAERRGA